MCLLLITCGVRKRQPPNCQVSWQLPFFNLNVLEREFNSDLVNYIYIGGTGVLEIKSVTDGAAVQFLLMSTL